VVATGYLNAGANGLLIDVIRNREEPFIDGVEVCDFKQGLFTSQFEAYMEEIRNKTVKQE
jgi:hypothetical protein